MGRKPMLNVIETLICLFFFNPAKLVSMSHSIILFSIIPSNSVQYCYAFHRESVAIILYNIIHGDKNRKMSENKLVEYYMSLPYQMLVDKDPDEKGYVISFPDLKGCLTSG